MSDKIQTGIRFEEEMLFKITYIAKRNHRSFNAQMEHLTQICIEEYEAKHGEVRLYIEANDKTIKKRQPTGCLFLPRHVLARVMMCLPFGRRNRR